MKYYSQEKLDIIRKYPKENFMDFLNEFSYPEIRKHFNENLIAPFVPSTLKNSNDNSQKYGEKTKNRFYECFIGEETNGVYVNSKGTKRMLPQENAEAAFYNAFQSWTFLFMNKELLEFAKEQAAKNKGADKDNKVRITSDFLYKLEDKKFLEFLLKKNKIYEISKEMIETFYKFSRIMPDSDLDEKIANSIKGSAIVYQYRELKKRNEEIDKRIEQLDEEVKEVGKQNENLMNEVGGLGQKNEEKDNEIKKLQEDNKKLEVEKQNLSNEITDLKKQNEELELENEGLKEEIDILNTSNKALKVANDELADENEELKEKNIISKNQNSNQKNFDLDEVRKHMRNQFKMKLEMKDEEIKKIQDEYDDLKYQYDDIKDKYDELKNKNEQIDLKVSTPQKTEVAVEQPKSQAVQHVELLSIKDRDKFMQNMAYLADGQNYEEFVYQIENDNILVVKDDSLLEAYCTALEAETDRLDIYPECDWTSYKDWFGYFNKDNKFVPSATEISDRYKLLKINSGVPFCVVVIHDFNNISPEFYLEPFFKELKNNGKKNLINPHIEVSSEDNVFKTIEDFVKLKFVLIKSSSEDAFCVPEFFKSFEVEE